MIPKQVKLSEFFKLFSPTHVLGTTYTLSLAFFESVVFPHIDKEKLERVLIISDPIGYSRASQEGSALRQAGQDYVVVAAPTKARFHPKVWIMWNQEKLALLCGSGNLTQSGFIENYELFELVIVDKDQPDGKSIAKDVTEFLEGLADLWADFEYDHPCVSFLQEMLQLTKDLDKNFQSQKTPSIRFLSSFGGSFADQLKGLCPYQHDALYFAAPYFGGSIKGIESYRSKLSSKKFHLFPAVHSDGSLDLPVELFESGGTCSIEIIENPKKTFAHLKMFAGKTKKDAWSFCGSVNGTLAAINGPNIEAGIWRRTAPETLEKILKPKFGAKLPEKRLPAMTKSNSRWGVFWALDKDGHVVLTASPALLKHAPLSNCSVEISIGADHRSIHLSKLFTDSKPVRIPWSSFGLRDADQSTTMMISIRAICNDLEPIEGKSIVDRYESITARPGERNAMRAVYSLLRGEGVPDFGDFSLVCGMLNDLSESISEELDEQEATGDHWGRESKEKKQPEDPGEALWPPMALDGASSRAGNGNQVAFFTIQKVLNVLFAKRISKGTDVTRPNSVHDDGEVPDLDSESVEAVLGVDERELERLRQSWETVFDSFERMEGECFYAAIEKKFAMSIWPLATGVFLMLALMRKYVVEHSRDALGYMTSTAMIQRFLNLMFHVRYQGDDYSLPDGCRHKSTAFPSIADDLASTFEVRPPERILEILHACFVYLHASEKGELGRLFPVADWLNFKRIAGDAIVESEEHEANLANIIRSLLQDTYDLLPGEKLRTSISEISKIDWDHHQGYRDLLYLKALAKGDVDSNFENVRSEITAKSDHMLSRIRRKAPFYLVPKNLMPYCTQSGCSMAYSKDNQKYSLMSGLPVICDGCGTLLIPSILLAEFTKREGQL